jgi:hypothetical protein
MGLATPQQNALQLLMVKHPANAVARGKAHLSVVALVAEFKPVECLAGALYFFPQLQPAE